MSTKSGPNALVVTVGCLAFMLAITYFPLVKAVRWEQPRSPTVSSPRGLTGTPINPSPTDSISCQPDPNAFGGAAMVIDGLVTRAQCDSIIAMHRRGYERTLKKK